MPYNVEELKAIRKYADDNNAIPQLSVRPHVRFKLRKTGEIVTRTMSGLLSDVKAAKREEAEQKKREAKKKRRAEENARKFS